MHDDVEIIEEMAFYQCHSLRIIKLSGVRVIEDTAFCNSALIAVYFGDKLETIGDDAFAGIPQRNIKLPSKVRTIGKGAFNGCIQLTDMELSEDLERIGGGAFNYCPRLRRIAMPLKEDLFGEDTIYNVYMFSGCRDLSQVDLVGGIHKTVSSLLLESWRSEMKDEIDRINQDLPNIDPDNRYQKTATIRRWMERVLDRIEYYKYEHYTLLKEFTTLLELALWKANLDENVVEDAAAREAVRLTRGHLKRARKGRCITSGASVVIKNVLPFLKLE